MQHKFHNVLHIDFSNVLGKGACGTVYKGTYDGRDVAVKELKSQNIVEQTMFEMEAKVLLRADHPNIVSIYKFINQQPHPHRIILEFCAVGTLNHYLHNLRVPHSSKIN